MRDFMKYITGFIIGLIAYAAIDIFFQMKADKEQFGDDCDDDDWEIRQITEDEVPEDIKANVKGDTDETVDHPS